MTEPASPGPQWRRGITSRPLWSVVALLAATSALHYLTPQTRLLCSPLDVFLRRHAAERIIFILPIAIATFAFRQRGGAVTLVLTLLIMLPRALWLSPYPGDALVEIAAVAVVACLVIWTIETQAEEKALRQKAVLRLEAISAVTAIVTGSLELKQILNDALAKVLEVTNMEAGLIFFLDPLSQELALVAHRGIAAESLQDLDRLRMGEGFCGRVAQAGELMVVHDSSQDPRLTRPAVRREGLQAQVITPLKSQRQVQGVLAVATRRLRQFLPEELDLIAAIGNQIGVAIENARLYENLRFYVQEITRAQEKERKRIARELHDETIQMLIFISRRLEALAALPEPLPETAMPHLESLQELIRNTLRDLRRFIHDLRPPTLDHLGLVAALEGLVGDLEKNGIEMELQVTGQVQRLVSEDAELVLFRVAQEALNNVRRHSGASQARVQLVFQRERVRMTIQDNGCGFDAPGQVSDLASSGRLGLIGMHERTRTLRGALTVQSEPGQGTVVIVDVPL